MAVNGELQVSELNSEQTVDCCLTATKELNKIMKGCNEHIVHTLHINTQPERYIHTCNTHGHAHTQTLLSAGKHCISKQQPSDIISSSFLSCLQSDASKEDKTQADRKKKNNQRKALHLLSHNPSASSESTESSKH